MKPDALHSFAHKFLVGIITAVVLAGSGAVVKATTVNAQQDVQLQTHAESLKKIDKLSDQIDELNKNVVVLNDRLNRENGDREPRH